MLEALCGRCGETFNPADVEDFRHVAREDGTPCDGPGVIMGAWGGWFNHEFPPLPLEQAREWVAASLHRQTGDNTWEEPCAIVAFHDDGSVSVYARHGWTEPAYAIVTITPQAWNGDYHGVITAVEHARGIR